MPKYDELAGRIEALDNGWTKEADDILKEIRGGYKLRLLDDMTEAGWIQVFDNNESIITTNRYREEFHYGTQCEKMSAFKKALMWLLNHSDISKKDEKTDKMKGLELQINAQQTVLDSLREELDEIR